MTKSSISSLLHEAEAHFSAGHMDATTTTLQTVLDQAPDHSLANFYMGLIDYQNDNYAAARDRLRRALRAEPKNLEARLYLGFSLLYLNELAAAEIEMRTVLAEADLAEAHQALASILIKMGRLEEAEAPSRRAVALAPDDVGVLNSHAGLLMQQRKFLGAQEVLTRVLSVEPELPAARLNAVLVEIELGHLDRAETQLAEMEAEPGKWPDLRVARAKLLIASDRGGEAVPILRALTDQQPNFFPAKMELGNALMAADNHTEAAVIYEEALGRMPGSMELHFNLALARKADGDLAAAWSEMSEAIRLDPSNPSLYYNRALINFLRGNFDGGCVDYDHRWASDPESFIRRPFSQPAWRTGMDLTSKRVLVWGEQGVGDHILYGSLLSWIVAEANHVLFECDARLAPAFQRGFPELEVIAATPEPDARALATGIEVQLPIADLMLAVPDWPEDFPFRDRYLEPDPTRAATVKRNLENVGGNVPRIGIAWQSMRQRVGPRKSAPLNLWRPILADRDCLFVNLQYGDTGADIAQAEHEIGVQIYSDPDIDRFHDLEGMLALIDGLDLVITTSNITAHLTASLGKPCWLLLHSNPLWYWGREGRDVLFYPTARAFRQPAVGKWQPAIDEIAETFRVWLEADGKSVTRNYTSTNLV